LQKEYAFHLIRTDDDVRLIGELVVGSYDRSFVISCLAKFPLMVVEWGFVPDLYLDNVIALKYQGAKLFWFTGDEDFVYQAYCDRVRGDPVALVARERQMKKIKEQKLPTSDFQIVETTRGKGFRPLAELDGHVLGAQRKSDSPSAG
jgi:hypothetical protein